MNDRIDSFLQDDGERWRSGLDPDPDLSTLLGAKQRRGSRRPALVAAASVVVLVVALSALILHLRQHAPHTAPLAAGSTGPTSTTPASTTTTSIRPTRAAGSFTCTNGTLHAPGIGRDTATPIQLHTFDAAGAVECTYEQRRYSDGVWLVVLQRMADGDIASLVSALDKADTPYSPVTGCLQYADLAPQLALVDAHGNYLRPRYPRDGCGHLQAGAKAATAKLHWTTISTTKINLDVPNDPVLRTCQQSWKNMIVLDSAHLRLSPGGPISPAHTTTACIFHTDTDATAGTYTVGARLDQQQTLQLADALSGKGRAAHCTAAARFAVIHFGQQTAYVELGGCWRVVRPDNTIGHADSATVQRILKL